MDAVGLESEISKRELAKTMDLSAVTAASAGAAIASLTIFLDQWEAAAVGLLAIGQLLRINLPDSLLSRRNLVEYAGCLAYVYACIFFMALTSVELSHRIICLIATICISFLGFMVSTQFGKTALGSVLRPLILSAPILILIALVSNNSGGSMRTLAYGFALLIGIFAGFPMIWLGYCLQIKIDEYGFGCTRSKLGSLKKNSRLP